MFSLFVATFLLAAGPIGTSPANEVVSRAPMAVSVTFDEPLRAEGARMRVLTEAGDVGEGAVGTADRTLRRDLRAGAPAGPYTVEWTAVAADGRRLQGSFSFTAARGNGVPERTAPGAVSNPSARTPGWADEPDPVWSTGLSGAGSGPADSSGSGSDDVFGGFAAVPLTVGGLLVLAAGVVSLVNRRQQNH